MEKYLQSLRKVSSGPVFANTRYPDRPLSPKGAALALKRLVKLVGIPHASNWTAPTTAQIGRIFSTNL